MMFESHLEKDTYAAKFSAAFENVDILCDEISRLTGTFGHGSDSFSLHLIIREALNNAIVHGSGSDQEKTIKVELKIEEKGISVTVHDQGTGFDWRTQQKKIAHPLVPSGRGMELMKTYASEVVFNDAGNMVTLKISS